MNSWNNASEFSINDFSEEEAPDCWHWLLKKIHYHVTDGCLKLQEDSLKSDQKFFIWIFCLVSI